MKSKIISVKIILFILLFSSYFTTFVEAAKKAFIVMKVNNEIITNINIENEYRYLIALNNELKSVNKKEIFNLAKNSVLRERIKEKEVLKYYNFNQNNRYLNDTLKKMYTGLNINSNSEFEKYLLGYKLSIEDVKKKIEIEILWNQLIYEKFKDQIEIDEEKIKKEINELIKKSEIKKNFFLYEIFFNEGSKKKNDEKYELIKKSISELGFKSTANLHSISSTSINGGEIGWVQENQLSNKILSEIKKIEIGNFTQPISVSGGLLILKLQDIKNTKIDLDFDNEFKKYIDYERNKQLNQFSTIYFNKIKFNTKID